MQLRLWDSHSMLMLIHPCTTWTVTSWCKSYRQNRLVPEFQNRLLGTGTSELVEDTGDEYWTRGLCNDGESQKLNQRKNHKSKQQRTISTQDARGRYHHQTRYSHCEMSLVSRCRTQKKILQSKLWLQGCRPRRACQNFKKYMYKWKWIKYQKSM